jgi:hypothetical protein
MRNPLIFLFFFIGCTSKPLSDTIFVEVTPNKLLLEKRQIDKNKFESELKLLVDIRIKKGFKREDLTIDLKVDKETLRGDIVDLESAMRHLKLRQVIYSSFENDQQMVLRLE